MAGDKMENCANR